MVLAAGRVGLGGLADAAGLPPIRTVRNALGRDASAGGEPSTVSADLYLGGTPSKDGPTIYLNTHGDIDGALARVVEAGVKYGILAGVALDRFNPDWSNRLLVAVTEKRTKTEMDEYCRFLKQEFAS